SRVSLASQAKLHAVVDAGGHLDVQAHDLPFAARARAGRAFFADHLAGSPAGGTGRLNPEKPLGLNDLAAPGAVAARFRRRAGFGAGTVAGRAQFSALDLDRPRAAEGRLAQVELDRSAQALTASRTRSSGAPPRGSAEEPLEHVAERAED